MKKRLLSALLALALVFVLLPTAALADTTPVTDENVKINGTAVTVGNDISLGDGNGTYSYDKSTHTLTLNNATITATGSNIGISFGVPVKGNIDYKIELIGTNTVTSSAQAIYVEYDSGLDQQGTQKLSTLTINGPVNSQLSLNVSSKEAIWSKGDFTLSGGTAVTAFSSGEIAVNVGSMTINNSKLSAQSSSYGTTVVLYGFEMIGDAAEFEALNTSSGVRAVLRTSGASENIDWSKYQLITGSYSGNALTKSEPTVCDKNTLNKLFSSSSTTRYIHIAKRTIPALQRTPDVLIAGEQAIVGQKTSLGEGKGYYTYNKDTKTLTLEDATISSGINAIQFMANGSYTINLAGTNQISNVSSGIVASNVSGVNNVTVVLSGSGSLDISANQYAIDMQVGNLKFENTGEIKLTTGYVFTLPLNALRVKSGSIIIDNTKYDIVGVKQDKDGTREDISDNPNLDTILKGTSTDKDLYFKSITITPAAAKPSTIRYNGTTLKQGETITDGNGGTATVDSKNNTITLKNFNGTAALSFDATLADSTLVLEGTNTLSSIVTTQMGLTVSGSGSLTVGSIRVPNNTQHTANLTINGGAHVTVNRPSSEDEPAVEVSGNLTVTGEGTQLSAECTAATNPAIEVGGNVTISGNPGTNAYTVKAYNKYDTPRDRDDKLRPSQMPSAFEISGNLSISGSAQVMAQTDSDGAAVWMPKEKVISVVDASLIAQNSSHNFSTISFGDGSDMGNIYAKGQVNIVAENMLHSSSSLAHRAIKAFIYNHYSTGDSNPYYINVVSEGVQSGGKVNVIPGHCTSTGGYKVTITRGDAYSAPTTISRIIITGLTPPVKGETPVTTGVSLGTGLTVTEVTWGGTFTSDGEFKADESYTAHIKYTVDAGYMLATDAQCQDISAADTVRLNKSESQVEVTFHTGGGSTHQHVEGPWEADTQGGHHIKKCTECGEVMISEEHIYRYAYESPTTHKVNCGVCGVNFVRAHSYTDSYVPTVDGTQHHGKCICGAEETTLRDHVFVNGVCVCGVTQSGGDPTPDVPAAPTGLVGVAPTSENGNGKITGTTAQMEYATSLEGDWTACANDSTDVPAGKYYVRMKKTDNTPAGEAVEVTVPAYSGTGEIEPPTPDNPGTIVIIRPAEEEKPAQQPNPSTGANDLVGLAVAAAVAAALGSAALLRKHD